MHSRKPIVWLATDLVLSEGVLSAVHSVRVGRAIVPMTLGGRIILQATKPWGLQRGFGNLL